MAFIEAEFPKTISYKALGGPTFNTTVNEGKSGFEQRNKNWQVARGEWTVSLDTPGASSNVNPQVYIDQLTAFFLVVGGKANAFRLKDHKDFTSGAMAQLVGVSDGTTTNWQILKAYTSAGLTYTRGISKPITSLVVDYLGNALLDTVSVYLNGGSALAKNSAYVGGGTAKYCLDETTGSINFGSSTTVLGITGFFIVNGFRAYNCTLIGPAPVKNQQVIISGLATSGANGTFLITGIGPGYIVTNSAGASPNLTDAGVGYTVWSQIAISAVTVGGGNATFTYTLTAGAALAVGMRVNVSGMPTTNGVYRVASLGTGTFTATSIGGSTETHVGLGLSDWVPASSTVIASSFQFHFPVRFDTDNLALQLEESNIEGGQPIVTWNSITLKEVRIANGGSQG